MKLSKQERIDIIQLYGMGRCTQRQVLAMFAQRHPQRPIPAQSTICRLIRKFRRTGSIEDIKKPGRPKSATGPLSTARTVATIGVCGRTSVRRLAKQLNASRTSVHSIIRREGFFPYKFQTHQKLETDDSRRRLEFSMEMIDRINANPRLLNRIMFSDEATFQIDGVVIKHNHRLWSQSNPHWVKENKTQYARKVSVWCGIIKDTVIGPFFIEGNLNGKTYKRLLRRQVVPALVARFGERELWFQHDGAPAHWQRKVRAYLDKTFPRRWVGRNGEIEWPPRSPDLTPLDYYLWSYVKEQVFEGSQPSDITELKIRIQTAIVGISAGTIRNVVREFNDRLYYCLTADGEHFEQYL
jgi:hypothetical protein